MKGKKQIATLLACGVAFGAASCASAQAGADNPDQNYQATILSSMQGTTIALLDGAIGDCASNYVKGCAANAKYTDGIVLMTDRYAPKPATITWENLSEGALYYTVKVGLESDLSDAESYLVSDNSVDIDYLYSAKHYYYQIYAHYEGEKVVKSRVFDFYTADLPRTVVVEGVSNTRDIGGRYVQGGKYQVRQGMVYRGGEVDKTKGAITEEGKRVMLYELGIKTDLDLRDGITYKTSPIDASLKYVNVSAPYYVGTTGINTTDAEYRNALTTEVRTFASAENYPIYLHCSLGRDRAGTLSFLIGALIGIEEVDLYRDYEMSFFSVNGWADAKQSVGVHQNLMRSLDSLTAYLKQYGNGTLQENTEKYVKEYLGITQEEVDSIRNILLEEV